MNVDAPKREREKERWIHCDIIWLPSFHVLHTYFQSPVGKRARPIPGIEIVSALSTVSKLAVPAILAFVLVNYRLILILSINQSINQSSNHSIIIIIIINIIILFNPSSPSDRMYSTWTLKITSTHFQSTLLQALQTLQALLIQSPSCVQRHRLPFTHSIKIGSLHFCTLQNPLRRSFGWILNISIFSALACRTNDSPIISVVPQGSMAEGWGESLSTDHRRLHGADCGFTNLSLLYNSPTHCLLLLLWVTREILLAPYVCFCQRLSMKAELNLLSFHFSFNRAHVGSSRARAQISFQPPFQTLTWKFSSFRASSWVCCVWKHSQSKLNLDVVEIYSYWGVDEVCVIFYPSHFICSRLGYFTLNNILSCVCNCH